MPSKFQAFNQIFGVYMRTYLRRFRDAKVHCPFNGEGITYVDVGGRLTESLTSSSDVVKAVDINPDSICLGILKVKQYVC